MFCVCAAWEEIKILPTCLSWEATGGGQHLKTKEEMAQEKTAEQWVRDGGRALSCWKTGGCFRTGRRDGHRMSLTCSCAIWDSRIVTRCVLKSDSMMPGVTAVSLSTALAGLVLPPWGCQVEKLICCWWWCNTHHPIACFWTVIDRSLQLGCHRPVYRRDNVEWRCVLWKVQYMRLNDRIRCHGVWHTWSQFFFAVVCPGQPKPSQHVAFSCTN